MQTTGVKMNAIYLSNSHVAVINAIYFSFDDISISLSPYSLWLNSSPFSCRCCTGFAQPIWSMISAVELHAGPGGGIGIYSHHPPFGRPSSGASAHHQQQQQQSVPMSGTEFARPKPKNIGSLNGLATSASSPTHKYSHHEQNGPVNLAVNHQTTRGSPPSKVEHLSDQKEIDVVGLGMSSSSPIGSPMSYATTSSRISYPAALGTNAYQALNYSFYGNRYG